MSALAVATQLDQVRDLLGQRANLDQSYDEGPNGRFGGQQKARALIVEHPFGIGTHTFRDTYHHEEPHNVYLTQFLNAGWLGGMIYIMTVTATLYLGFRTALQRTRLQGPAVIAFASFAGLAFEGFVIDSDHWRHFFLYGRVDLGAGGCDACHERHAAAGGRRRGLARVLTRIFGARITDWLGGKNVSLLRIAYRLGMWCRADARRSSLHFQLHQSAACGDCRMSCPPVPSWLGLSPCGAQDGPPVDTALVVSVDVSNSVDDARYRLQMEGIAKALEDPGVIEAITGGSAGGILFSMVTWADTPSFVIPWIRIANKADAFAAAKRVRSLPQQGGEFTCMTRMLRSANDKIVPQIPAKAARIIIDVSGDGPDNCNAEEPIETVRNELVSNGVTINGLPILLDTPEDSALLPKAVPGGPPPLEQWYRAARHGRARQFRAACPGLWRFRTRHPAKIRHRGERPAAARSLFDDELSHRLMTLA